MTSKLQKYTTTIVGMLVTISLSLISGFMLKLPTEITWVTFFIGSMMTITITMLEQRLLEANSEEFNRKLEIYRLLEQIEDKELYNRGQATIEKCRAELENLSKGVLRLEVGQLFRYLIEVTESAKHHIRTTHIGLDDKYIAIWQTTGEEQWYQQNVKSAKKGIIFERLFILSETTAIDSTSGKLKSIIKEVLQKQLQDGIKVLVAWQEELDTPELIQDFGVIDNNVVLVTNPSWTSGYSNVNVYRRKFDVDRYIEIFEALRSRCRPIAELTQSTT